MPLTFASTATLLHSAHPSAKLGGSTMLLVYRRNFAIDGAAHFVLSFQNSTGTGKAGLLVSNGLTDTWGVRSDQSGGGNYAPTQTVTSAEGWVCIAASKASGAAAPRFHKYNYLTGVFSHENYGVASIDGTVLGAGGVARLSGLGTVPGIAHGPGNYAAAAFFDRVLTDAEFESCVNSLSAMKALGPNWGLWTFDAGVSDADEFFIGSTVTAGAASSVLTEGPPFGYGYPVDLASLPSSGGSGDAVFTGGGILTSTGSGSVAPPDPTPPGPVGTGWTLLAVNRANVAQEVRFTDTGQFTHDQSRPVRRAISGFTLLPSEAEKIDLQSDSIHAYLRVNDQSYPMGIFYFTESSRQKSAVIGLDGEPADLIHVSLADQFIRLQRSDEVPRVALAGADPSQEMIRYLNETDVPHSITGTESPIAQDVMWQPFTTYEQIVSQLAELAGHRRPWADNYGVIRSVASRVVDSEVIPLEDLNPVAGTLVVTENYLSAPNRVVVYDDQGEFPVTGSWDAPASAPNSATRRGWVQTVGVQAQGLSGPIHAQQIAETIGEQMAARRMAGDILPTNRLDGPVILSYDDALWIVNGWSVSTKVGSTMSFDASELIIDPSGEFA